ncbi:MAG: UDP-N-acetylmuramate--L-alanine ligase [Bacteroides sp.]|nr:UDP-N-acetylmuramate--L-alanine ligase [Bacteroides sp.]MDD4054530.1 UDP-N-acetylmuramate--L-alanine ligase [Bacteroides sp.]MDD4719425.1 UDP-N-acetylmuramate--L-alanine ligase [Bacteroides sp.]
MTLENIKNIFFIGIGGIGMSALARYFLFQGKNVGGYDKTPSILTKELEKEGANIHYNDSLASIPASFKNKEETLIIYTPAISTDHKEFQYFQSNHFQIKKRAEVLGLITQSSKGLCIAGTHGKTTTSTMLAHILHQSHIDCNAFLGGISKNYNTNLLLSTTSQYSVIEADEYDRSFHWLTPYIAVITSAEPDHLDIYGSEACYMESFEKFTSLIQPNGTLLLREGLSIKPKVQKGVKIYTYSINKGDYYAENILIENGEIIFDFITPNKRIREVKLGVPIAINIENSIAAMAVALLTGATQEEVKKGIESYKGVDRRFDFQIKSPNLVFLNDYAHHPAEVKQSIASIRQLYPEKKITGVFQPHLYSRTQSFYREFAKSLSLLDRVILLDIYPAREQPIMGVSSQLIYDELDSSVEKRLIKKDELLHIIEDESIEVLITLGAGDINTFVPFIKNILLKKL